MAVNGSLYQRKSCEALKLSFLLYILQPIWVMRSMEDREHSTTGQETYDIYETYSTPEGGRRFRRLTGHMSSVNTCLIPQRFVHQIPDCTHLAGIVMMFALRYFTQISDSDPLEGNIPEKHIIEKWDWGQSPPFLPTAQDWKSANSGPIGTVTIKTELVKISL